MPDELPEWEVAPARPMVVSGKDPQQAADEAFRLWTEDPADPDPNITWWVRPADPPSPEPWQPVEPALPPMEVPGA